MLTLVWIVCRGAYDGAMIRTDSSVERPHSLWNTHEPKRNETFYFVGRQFSLASVLTYNIGLVGCRVCVCLTAVSYVFSGPSP